VTTEAIESRAALALRLYEIQVELRPDRVPPLSHVEWGALNDERKRVLVSLGWRPNEGRR
jgi:hypothetical protein